MAVTRLKDRLNRAVGAIQRVNGHQHRERVASEHVDLVMDERRQPGLVLKTHRTSAAVAGNLPCYVSARICSLKRLW